MAKKTFKELLFEHDTVGRQLFSDDLSEARRKELQAEREELAAELKERRGK